METAYKEKRKNNSTRTKAKILFFHSLERMENIREE